MKIKAMVLSSVLATFTHQASAAYVWSSSTALYELYPHDVGLIVHVAENIAHNSACPKRFIVHLSDPNYETKASSLLAAFFANSTVKLHFDDGHTGCETPVDRFIVEK